MSAKKSEFVLNNNVAAEITTCIKSDVGSNKKWRKLGESLHSVGVTTLMLDKPAKGKENQFQALHDQIKAHIVLGFDADVQRLINTSSQDVGKLSQADQAIRSYWNKQISSLFNKIRKHVDNIQNPKASKAREPLSHEGKAIESLKKAKEELQKIEAAQFDVTLTIKAVDQALALIK